MQFGPTFADEIEAAGLLGLPFAWTADGEITGRDALSSAQRKKLDAVIAAHLPDSRKLDDYSSAIQEHIDAAARSRDYDSGVTCASWVNSTNPVWAGEATAFVAWRDAVWAYAYGELEKVQAGTRPPPNVAEILAELPSIQWPAAQQATRIGAKA